MRIAYHRPGENRIADHRNRLISRALASVVRVGRVSTPNLSSLEIEEKKREFQPKSRTTRTTACGLHARSRTTGGPERWGAGCWMAAWMGADGKRSGWASGRPQGVSEYV